MYKTVDLVNEWASFEGKHPDANIEARCLKDRDQVFGALASAQRQTL